MIPIRDNIPPRTVPLVNYALIALTTLVFFKQLADERSPQPNLVEKYGMIPLRVFHPQTPIAVPERVAVQTPYGVQYAERMRVAAAPPINPWWTLLTCIFLHGGWMHFLGNMWFLHIFGDNVEDRIGHLGYLIFYLGCGIAASASHLVTNLDSSIPTVGASGAIAGVMGAYFLLYPRSKVVSVIPIIFFLEVIVLPAPVFLGIWFFLQFLQGTLTASAAESGGGVAWWAHIGGFVAGFAVAALLRAGGHTRPPVEEILPHTDHVTAYRY
jgi:membrane associated rhomboid family serine protease